MCVIDREWTAAISPLLAVVRAVGFKETVCLKISVYQRHATRQGHDRRVGVLKDSAPTLRLKIDFNENIEVKWLATACFSCTVRKAWDVSRGAVYPRGQESLASGSLSPKVSEADSP